MYQEEGKSLIFWPVLSPMDGGAWKAAVRGVAEGRTRLSDFTSLSLAELYFVLCNADA